MKRKDWNRIGDLFVVFILISSIVFMTGCYQQGKMKETQSAINQLQQNMQQGMQQQNAQQNNQEQASQQESQESQGTQDNSNPSGSISDSDGLKEFIGSKTLPVLKKVFGSASLKSFVSGTNLNNGYGIALDYEVVRKITTTDISKMSKEFGKAGFTIITKGVDVNDFGIIMSIPYNGKQVVVTVGGTIDEYDIVVSATISG